MNKLFPTYEVGSMPKLNARVKAFRADPENPVTKKDLDQISNYSSRISLFSENLISLLENQIHTGEKLDSISKKEIIDFNALLNLI